MSIGRNTIDGRKLLGFIERVERLRKVKKAASDDIKIVKAEATKEGLSPKGIDFAVAVREMKPSQFRESEDLRDLYLSAIGLGAPPPLFKHLESLAHEALGKSELIERFKDLVPAGGSITLELDGPGIRITRDKDGNTKAEEVKPPKASVTRASAGEEEAEPEVEVPDIDEDGAEQFGRDLAKADRPITDNPFPSLPATSGASAATKAGGRKWGQTAWATTRIDLCFPA